MMRQQAHRCAQQTWQSVSIQLRNRPCFYATTTYHEKPRRTAVTVLNDTGRIRWTELSVKEKVARVTQQTLNLGLVVLGVGLTGAVFTVLYLEVFATSSKTAIFNKVTNRIRADSTCQEMLNGKGTSYGTDIQAYGEPSWSRWARNRVIASRVEKDSVGNEHLHMHFNVEGSEAKGTVLIHMIKMQASPDFRYVTLALDVPGHSRYYLENVKEKTITEKTAATLFGVRFR